jgi:hypothetical protein
VEEFSPTFVTAIFLRPASSELGLGFSCFPGLGYLRYVITELDYKPVLGKKCSLFIE